MTEIRKRIIGSEMEYPISVLENDGRKNPRPLKVTPEFIEDYLPEGLVMASDMLSNGARYYSDLAFAEYATPEELDFDEMAIREFAGERIVIDSLTRYFNDNPDIQFASIRKRVLDDNSKTWGYHLSLSADIKKIKIQNAYSMHLMGLHIATSQPLFGAGTTYYSTSTKQREYSYGQKIHDPELIDCSRETIEKSGIINLRDEPLADREKYRRIHVTCLDPHISPWAAAMMPGTLSLVLRAIEQGLGHKIGAGLYSGKALTTIARVSANDLTHQRAVRMHEAPDMTPFQIQQEIIEIVEQTHHTDEEHQILLKWRKALEDFEQDPMLLADRSDAIGRLSLIRYVNTQRGNDPDDMTTAAAISADNHYDQIFKIGTQRYPRGAEDPFDAYLASYANQVRTKQKMSELSIRNAILHPPKTTRAHARGNLIANGDVSSAAWGSYTINGQTSFIHDPYQTEVE